jgi:DNA-binding transcriptional regulator LsrR (DeoR family)
MAFVSFLTEGRELLAAEGCTHDAPALTRSGPVSRDLKQKSRIRDTSKTTQQVQAALFSIPAGIPAHRSAQKTTRVRRGIEN